MVKVTIHPLEEVATIEDADETVRQAAIRACHNLKSRRDPHSLPSYQIISACIEPKEHFTVARFEQTLDLRIREFLRVCT